MTTIRMADVPGFFSREFGMERNAIIFDGDVVSWADLDNASTEMAHALIDRGVGENDLVTLAMPNGCEFYKLSFAIWKAGATPHVVSPKLPETELGAILEVAAPRLLISEASNVVSRFGGTVPGDLRSKREGRLPSSTSTYWKATSSGGSTGRPKIVVDHQPAAVDPSQIGFIMPERSAILNPGPLYHNSPFRFTHEALFKGNTVIGMRRFDPLEALRLICEHDVEWANMVPTMLLRIWRLPEEQRNAFDLTSLRTLWHMAAPMPSWLKESLIDWIGKEKVWEVYGGTEATGGTIISGSEWLSHKGSVGRTIPGYALRVKDESGNDVPPGTIGEIYMAPENGRTTYHYLGDDVASSAGGLDSLGDYGYVDSDGYLYLADRRTDLVISGGVNIYPAEVENALMAHPGVDCAVVIGLPHEDLGASVHAIVRKRPEWSGDLDEQHLADFARSQLAAYKIPRSIEFTETVLRDEAGKVRRSQLRAERISDAAECDPSNQPPA